jgi:ABC-2 type transport system permease protein
MSATVSSQNKNVKATRSLVIVALLLIGLNIVSAFLYTQIDLTKDKRYTISAPTQALLKSQQQRTEVLVYLTGDKLPAQFKNLSSSTETMLRKFRDLSNNKVTYRFVDPLNDKDTATLAILKQFGMTGIPVSISEGNKGMQQKMVFPWALVTTVTDKGASVAIPVFLQETNTFNLNRQTLLKSELLLEYNLANTIQQIHRTEKASLAYLMGNGEQLDEHVVTALSLLAQSYNVDTFNINQADAIPSKYNTLVINRPILEFSEAQQFKIDQYIMQGGNVYWSINMVTGNLDSLKNGVFNAMPTELNLNNLLFKYGARINTNVIMDGANHAFVPLQVKGPNTQPSMFPWVYFPILEAASEHPIVKNLNGVLGRFTSSIDLNNNDEQINKTPLLSSTKYSKVESAPLPIILESAVETINPAAYMGGKKNAAVLLEGSFTSAFKNQLSSELQSFLQNAQLTFKENRTEPGKMIIVADADIITNEFSPKSGPSDLGQYIFDQQFTFDNKSFFQNCITYLADKDNLLAARNKTFENGILDPKLTQSATPWRLINIAIPVVSILLFGIIFIYLRKRKYA